jgi:arylsulfatase A-like enzyme
MNALKLLISAATITLLVACDNGKQGDEQVTIQKKPNVIIFYIDDLGYGDLGSYGAIGVETPSIDALAKNGIRFTDAHSSAATCTPSRYSLLTGEHGFRINAAVLKGDAPALIKPNKPTLPAMLKKAGYATAVVGKWHLGLGDGNVDWNEHISPGPNDIGFDYSFLLPATGDRVPTVYTENGRVIGLDPSDPITVSYTEKVGNRPTRYENPELARVVADRQHSDTIVNGVSRIGTMAGGESALWVDEEFPDVFTDKAIGFIRENQDKPFFLFHSYHDIHVPRLPHPRFQGKSEMGPRGDAIVQMDWMTGQIIDEIEKLGLTENTLFIFTSDNGPVLTDGYDDMAIEMLGEHKPAGPFRGGKYSAHEAGTRVPFIVSYKGVVTKGVSDQLLSQMDIYASLADMLNIELVNNEARDSVANADYLLGKGDSKRQSLIQESVATLSFRDGNWKYIAPVKTPKIGAFVEGKNIEGGFMDTPQLYNLAQDQSEIDNVAEQFPEKIALYEREMQRIIQSGYVVD